MEEHHSNSIDDCFSTDSKLFLRTKTLEATDMVLYNTGVVISRFSSRVMEFVVEQEEPFGELRVREEPVRNVKSLEKAGEE